VTVKDVVRTGNFNIVFLLEVGDMSVLLFVSLSGAVAAGAERELDEAREEMEKGRGVMAMDTEGGCRGEQFGVFLSIVVVFLSIIAVVFLFATGLVSVSSVFVSTGCCQEILPVRRWM
tara:strand:- start:47 stop:400 length:354 start_codon:yes stop_codon:yes gene_type:complete